MQIADAVAVVTGGASGLGLATTKTLLRHGARVLMVDLGVSFGKDFAAELGDDAHFAPADVTNTDALAVAFDIAQSLGPVRILVNCAGTASDMSVLGKHSPHSLEEFVRVVEVNLIGTFNVIRLAAERMVKTEPIAGERGVIINTSSIAAFDGQTGQAANSASKAGVVGMTLPIARDLAHDLIRVVTIAPGLFSTPLIRFMGPHMCESLTAHVPHPSRLGEADEFAALAAHIVENAMLNGEVIRLDGALRLATP